MRSVLLKESYLIMALVPSTIYYIHIRTCRLGGRVGEGVLPVSHRSREIVLDEADGALIHHPIAPG